MQAKAVKRIMLRDVAGTGTLAGAPLPEQTLAHGPTGARGAGAKQRQPAPGTAPAAGAAETSDWPRAARSR